MEPTEVIINGPGGESPEESRAKNKPGIYWKPYKDAEGVLVDDPKERVLARTDWEAGKFKRKYGYSFLREAVNQDFEAFRGKYRAKAQRDLGPRGPGRL